MAVGIPRGAGKSMLARRRACGLRDHAPVSGATPEDLGCGPDRGGQVPLVGEVSRMHHGILFLDELPECRCHVLEVLL
jgi:hypothetical protein